MSFQQKRSDRAFIRRSETGNDMNDGFVKVSCVTPSLKVCDIEFNTSEILKYMKETSENGAKVTVFPELSITGYTLNDLFAQGLILEKSKEALITIAKESAKYDGIFFVGLPFEFLGKLYNAAAAVSGGKILGIIPKKYLPNYHEFYEKRQFARGFEKPVKIAFGPYETYFGMNLLFTPDSMPDMHIAAELCEDLWVIDPPSVSHAEHGANVIVNLSASNEVIGKESYRLSLVSSQSAKLYSAYLYCSAGPDESTQDIVFSGHNIIAEDGAVLASSKLFSEGALYSEIDIEKLNSERRRMDTFEMSTPSETDSSYENISFHLSKEETVLTRKIEKLPFVPAESSELKNRSSKILDIQTYGLVKRLKHTGSKCAVIGISGGLDSTLALIVTVRAFDILSLDRKGIIAVTMPGFGTTDRTYNNAVTMVNAFGATLREVSISKAVIQHFSDIGQDMENHDVTYENSQARERTQILMDIANKENGLVIGTGDLSELALGWATYNGDHMSMYAVNVSVPKTLVRHLVKYYSDFIASSDELKTALNDVLATPVSPELLPPENGNISQKTEDLIGPYELHDFFLYYMMRFGFSPKKIFRMAKYAFNGTYSDGIILKWEKVFFRRFFTQQFKRSCIPDGPKVGSVSLSPRGDLRMPSDASSILFLKELDEIKI